VACVDGAFHYLETGGIVDPCVSATEAAKKDDAALIKITAAADKKTGEYPCTKVTKEGAATPLYAKWTQAGWAEAKTEETTEGNTTGAKAMAGALAAGALAVAATQF